MGRELVGGFLVYFGGAKTNRHLFRAGALRPTARGHESCSGRPPCAIIGKSTGYFCAAAPPKSARNPPRPRPADSGQPNHVLRSIGCFRFLFSCVSCFPAWFCWLAVRGVGLWGGGGAGVGRVGRELGGGFLVYFGGAKTNRHLFRAGALRPTARGHESNSGRAQCAIIGKSTGYFCAAAPPKSARNPPHARAAHSGQGPAGPFYNHAASRRRGLLTFQ